MNREEAKKKAEALVARMTLEEKASQLRYDAPAIKRLGIPAYNWWNEGLHGVARAGQATVFPQAIVQDSGSRQKTAGTLSVYYNKPAGVFQRIIPPLPSIFPLFPHFSANPRGKLSILYKKQFIFPQTGNIIIHMGEIQTDFLPISHRIGAITLAHPDRPDGAKGWAYQWKHRRFCRVSGGFILSASAARVCVRWPKSSMPWGTRSPVPMTWSRTTWPA